MKTFKNIVLIVVTCFGITLLLLGAALAWWESSSYIQAPADIWSQPDIRHEWNGFGYVSGFAVGLVGAIIALIGGTKIRTHFLWIGLIISGLLYCIPFIIGAVYVPYKEQLYPVIHPGASYADGIWMLVYLLPGIISVIQGIETRKPEVEPHNSTG